MTTPTVRQSRDAVIRLLASSMVFDEPPVTKSLSRARTAAERLYGVLVDAGVITTNGAAHEDDADDEDQPLFPANGITTDPTDPDPET